MMMYTNLFDPNYIHNVDTKSREWSIRYWIREYLTSALKYAKKNYKTSTNDYLNQLVGILHYMLSTGDIDEMTFNVIYGITAQIKLKYNIY